MPMEHEPAREAQGVHAPEWASRALLLAGTGLVAFSLIQNGGQAGALTAFGAGGLGVGLGYLVNRR